VIDGRQHGEQQNERRRQSGGSTTPSGLYIRHPDVAAHARGDRVSHGDRPRARGGVVAVRRAGVAGKCHHLRPNDVVVRHNSASAWKPGRPDLQVVARGVGVNERSGVGAGPRADIFLSARANILWHRRQRNRAHAAFRVGECGYDKATSGQARRCAGNRRGSAATKEEEILCIQL